VSDHEEVEGLGTPPWLISFGDMMTLFLCFFIVLVTMAPKQDAGLVAAGIGEFVNVLEGSGVGGALDGNARLEKVNEYRRRFGLKPLTLEEYLAGTPETKSSANLESLVQDALCDYSELSEPSIVAFEPGSATLTPEGLARVDRLASALVPGRKQLLVLEGHSGVDRILAARRALVVRQRLVTGWRFLTTRVEARGVHVAADPDEADESSRSVDVRLIEPQSSRGDS
jgi:outer membrane protein OmpA-like peptidoglycan-associated protein